jgi:hypothetical protein
MSSKRVLFAAIIAGLLALSLGTYWAGAHAATGEAADAFTRTYNLLGYEGIGSLGYPWSEKGRTPPVGDYVTTHCRYIDVQNTYVNQYFLRYPLHLPQGVTITKVALYVADFNSSGYMWAYLRSRPWNSYDFGDTIGTARTDNTSNSARTIEMDLHPDIKVDNDTTEYWIDINPLNGDDPGQLCVYGIQVTYSIDGALLPLVERGG